MKRLLVVLVVPMVLLASIGTVRGEIEKFLESRPSFKALSAKEVAEGDSLFPYDVYFVDSAYRSERGDIVITALVRKKQIVAYHITISIEDRRDPPLGSNEMDDAITSAYDRERFSETFTGTVGVNDRATLHWMLVDKEAWDSARQEEVEKLAKRLKP